MKFSPRKAVLAGVTALALSTTALTAAPAIAEENQQKNSIPASSEIFEKAGSSEGNGKESKESKESTETSKQADSEKKEKPAEDKKEGSSQEPAGDKKEGSSLENKGSSEGGFNFKKFSEILKAISGVVGVASTIFAFLKSLKII